MTAPFILGNVLLDARGEAWGVYRVPTVSYPLLAVTLKQQLFGRLAAFAHGAHGDITIWRVTRLAPDAAGDRHADRGVECYAAIRLDAERTGGMLGRILRSPRAVPARLALAKRVVDQIRERELDLRAHARETLDARPATSQELVWLTTRTRTLGAGEPALDQWDHRPALHVLDTDTVIVEPAQVQRLAMPDAALMEHPDRIEMHAGEHQVHHAALVLGCLPDGLEFPGRAELAFAPLERTGVIADIVIHARWSSNAAALKGAGRTILDADNATSEQASTGRVGDTRLTTQLDTALDYKRYLESADAPPILSASITMLLAASTPRDLDRACSELAAALAPVRVARPKYAQRALWDSVQSPMRCARGASAQHLTVEQLAALMPVATERVGTAHGPVIGVVRSSGRPVRLDLAAASQASRPPSILCVGTLGSGKTMTSQLIAAQALERGSLVVDVDPKPDHQLDSLPQLAGRSRVIDLADVDQHQGLLDPLTVSDPAMREEIAAGFYADLIDASSRQRALLRTALTELLTHKDATSADLIRTLSRMPHPEASDAAEQLAAWSTSGLARLALGTRTATSTNGESALDLTSIRCRSLVLPDASTARADHTEAERVSCAIMRLIATYALRLALSDRSRHKLVIIDEAWLLLGSPDGRTLIDRINRTGRSENATLLLATQQLGDAAHTAPLIGTHLVFGLETRDEASSAAALLGIDDTPELAQTLQSQRTGQAVMRDTDGQLAQIQINVPPELLAHLSTTPPEATT
ncbi:MAG: hypothetical protein JWL76_362 [Thermoleophilia bacterium]|nr:hypothetical protein [Thermoleophilia bacterium]